MPQKTEVPGEEVWPTQPIPTKPEPFSRQSFTATDVNPHILSPEEREEFRANAWRRPATRVRSRRSGSPTRFTCPATRAASNWGSTASNPSDGSVYVIGFNVPTIIRLLRAGETRTWRVEKPEVIQEGRYVTEGLRALPEHRQPALHDADRLRPQQGRDQVADSVLVTICGWSGRASPAPARAATIKGGIIPTATGLVFVTAADRKVHVYDSATGSQIHELQLGGLTSGSPSMYELNGRQYLLVTVSPTQRERPRSRRVCPRRRSAWSRSPCRSRRGHNVLTSTPRWAPGRRFSDTSRTNPGSAAADPCGSSGSSGRDAGPDRR